jgi:hypothetical protein
MSKRHRVLNIRQNLLKTVVITVNAGSLRQHIGHERLAILKNHAIKPHSPE